MADEQENTLWGRPMVVNPDMKSLEGRVLFGQMDKYRSVTYLKSKDGKCRRLVEGVDFVRDPRDPSVAVLSGGRRVPIETV